MLLSYSIGVGLVLLLTGLIDGRLDQGHFWQTMRSLALSLLWPLTVLYLLAYHVGHALPKRSSPQDAV